MLCLFDFNEVDFSQMITEIEAPQVFGKPQAGTWLQYYLVSLIPDIVAFRSTCHHVCRSVARSLQSALALVGSVLFPQLSSRAESHRQSVFGLCVHDKEELGEGQQSGGGE